MNSLTRGVRDKTTVRLTSWTALLSILGGANDMTIATIRQEIWTMRPIKALVG